MVVKQMVSYVTHHMEVAVTTVQIPVRVTQYSDDTVVMVLPKTQSNVMTAIVTIMTYVVTLV